MTLSAKNDAVLQEKSAKLQLLALDVDGVLTDGCLYFGASGDAMKAFNSLDGHGLKMLRQCGVEVAIITGRRSDIVAARAAELGVEILLQGREDKLVALKEVCAALSLDLSQAAYMGDDLPDLSAIQAAGVGITVSNAARGLSELADVTTTAAGGRGAVREACEYILCAKGLWQDLLGQYTLAEEDR